MGRIVIFSIISHFESNEGDAETSGAKDETDSTDTSIALKQVYFASGTTGTIQCSRKSIINPLSRFVSVPESTTLKGDIQQQSICSGQTKGKSALVSPSTAHKGCVLRCLRKDRAPSPEGHRRILYSFLFEYLDKYYGNHPYPCDRYCQY